MPAETPLRFGEELKKERETLGVPLEAVTESTKVSLRNLRALEGDDFDVLPQGVFQRGILRSYCRFLGLDEDLWLHKLGEAAASSSTEPDWAEFAENVKRARVPAGRSDQVRWWGVLAMLLVLAAAGFAVWKYLVRPRLQTSNTPSVVSPTRNA